MLTRRALLAAACLLAQTVALLAPTPAAPRCVAVRAGPRSPGQAFTKTGPRKPQSPRPEQYPDEAKLAATLTAGKNEKYDPEYSHDIDTAKRRLFDLRMRKSQRLPFKSSEFRELRKFVARLKTRQREDELRAAGVDLRKRQPRTRRERRRVSEKLVRKETNRLRNRAMLIEKGLLTGTPEDATAAALAAVEDA